MVTPTPHKTTPRLRRGVRAATLLVVGALLASCQPGPDPAMLRPSLHEAQRVAAQEAQREAMARITALAADRAGHLSDRSVAQARGVIERTVPKPPWSMFPGLEGKAQRLRESVRRERREDGPKPVLLLVMDTTRVDHLSAWGYSRETTPNLDKVAQESIRFSRFYSNGAWTRPSIASIMTSRYRGEHHCELAGAKLPDRMTTVAEVFKANGYATAAFVGNQTVRGAYNFDQGFDHYEDIHDEIEHNPKADEMVARTIRWLDHNDNDNWFIWLFLVDPHDPYTPVKEFDRWDTKSRYKRVGIPSPEYRSMPPRNLVKRMVALYDAEILQMDHAMGTLFDYFRERGIWDDLSVVVVTDHGEAFGENNSFRHPYHFWEPNIHVGFMMRSPEFKSHLGAVEDRLTQSVDVAPTLLDLAGLSYPEGWTPSGISAAAMVTGPITVGWDRSVYTELRGYGLVRWMVRRGDYKYLRFNPSDLDALKGVWEKTWEDLTSANHETTRHYLFNVAKDPWETRNVARRERTIYRAMAKDLKTFRRALRNGKRPIGPKIEPKFDQDKMDPEMLEDLRSLGYIE